MQVYNPECRSNTTNYDLRIKSALIAKQLKKKRHTNGAQI